MPFDQLAPASGGRPLDIAVVGSGISGMSAAWLLSQAHRVTVYERQDRLGGHSHTVEAPTRAGPAPVDMGFIVYNEKNYPNLVALFDHLGVATRASDMSFGVSLDHGRLEYSSNSLGSVFAQKRNLLSPRFWGMLSDLLRFYREAPRHACALDQRLTTLGDYLCEQGYGRAFQDDHLLPQAAAIWSTSAGRIREFPAAAFIRFCQNHGLLKINTAERPKWRTVEGGSRAYVEKLTAAYADRIRLGRGVLAIRRDPAGVEIVDEEGELRRYDHVVVAAHADEALRLLADPREAERELLGAFRYTRNRAVLHTDASLMPVRRSCWSSWNYVGHTPGGDGDESDLCVTYWMNRLQGLPEHTPLFVTLNPAREPDPASVIHSEVYEHPLFDVAAIQAQRRLWSLQGQNRTWYCGAYFGSGFHEDGLQAGLAVAEALGGVKRPWSTPDESGRIFLAPPTAPELGLAA